jgi:hypothetical protein
MSQNDFHIQRAWHDLLVYDEGEGRRIEFTCPSLGEPPRVHVPADATWAQRMPVWANGRRQIIVGRLRASGAIVYEQDRELTSVRSPDGTFRVECISQFDERAPAWERTRVVAMPGEQVLMHLPLHGVSGEIQFPQNGVVELPLLSRYGPKHQLRVNVSAGTFVLDVEAEQPLELLQARLDLDSPPQLPYARTKRSNRQQKFNDAALAVGCFLFVVGGIWMACAGKTTKDRWIGFMSTMFFGAGLISPIVQLYRSSKTSGEQRPAIARFAVYAPLAAVLAEIVWIVMLFAGFIFMVGDKPFTATAAQEQIFQIVAALPAMAGLAVGIVAIASRSARRRAEWVCLILGSAGCALFVGGLLWGLFH